MIIKELLELFDDWNISIKVNNRDLSKHTSERNIWIFWDRNKELLGKEITAFGLYDGELAIRMS